LTKWSQEHKKLFNILHITKYQLYTSIPCK